MELTRLSTGWPRDSHMPVAAWHLLDHLLRRALFEKKLASPPPHWKRPPLGEDVRVKHRVRTLLEVAAP